MYTPFLVNHPTLSRTVVAVLACSLAIAAAPPKKRVALDMDTLAVQAALDRAGVSPGLVDGHRGSQTDEAIALFQRAQGLPVTRNLDAATRTALRLDRRQAATQTYTITAADVAGPFIAALPEDLMAQGALDAASYTSVAELLAERFHTRESVITRLNHAVKFVEGAVLRVPDVEPMSGPTESKRRDQAGDRADRVSAVIVSKSPSVVTVVDAGGKLLFAAPVTSGSEHDPLPLGQWKVTDVYLLPVFHYNPALFWDADPSHAQTVIKPGPNNPTGVAWIDIDREHYGLHGTPYPETVGRTASHGCVRLTNWDVVRLLALREAGHTRGFR